ncbi:PAS domain-containing protein [Hymenobacter sp. BRD67]|uniref:PAS domain-containing protein n=1 Tax=Hymenobacter sp. BRD67 TaxID=2675877 RepID=UPI0039775202
MLASCLSQVSDGILLANSENTILMVNQAFCTLFGLGQPLAHWIGQPAELMKAQLFASTPDAHTLGQLLRGAAPRAPH